MIVLLLALLLLALLGVLTVVRWVRADSDGRPPGAGGRVGTISPAPARYAGPPGLNGPEIRVAARRLHWSDGRLSGDYLPLDPPGGRPTTTA